MEKLAAAALGKRLCGFGELLRWDGRFTECSCTDELVVFSKSVKPILNLTAVGVVGLVAHGAGV